jgi:lysophospholipase L1-like esterase
VRATVKLVDGTTRGAARFELLFELPPDSEFSISIGTRRLDVRDTKGATRIPNSPILRLKLEGDPRHVFTLETRRGRPRFYGIIVEGSEPGIVLDTVGIDGARIATTLAWAEAPFVAEVAARNPDLAVIAFGTNEAFDDLRVSAYDKQLAALLERIRSGAPRADCLILGPPDALSPGGDAAPRVAGISAVYAGTAQALGCAFVSQQELMGGAGSFVSWMREEPPLARSDRIHLTLKGYRRLGELVSEAVFGDLASGEVSAPAASR